MAPLPSASEILEHHYAYELDMLSDTYRLSREAQIQLNAYIESFCIHARNLIEFFRSDGRQYVDVVAMTNFDGNGKLVQTDFTMVNGVNPHCCYSNVACLGG
jgi:hypothetical protein